MEREIEEDESSEKISDLEEKRRADLQYKRSFFVRMVRKMSLALFITP